MAEMTFEVAVKRLEEIVKRLESGEALLEESLSLFEEGIRLTNLCSKKIAEAEKRVEILVKSESGALEAKEFAGKDEE